MLRVSEAFKQKLKDNLLIVAMSIGVAGYFVLDALIEAPEARATTVNIATGILPYLLFTMLFLEFSKINPRDLFPKRWIVYSFAYQLLMTGAMILLLLWSGTPEWTRTMWLGTLVCVLSPTATAVAVMSSKLGGKGGSATTYAVLSSLFTAIAVPLFFPIVSSDNEQLSFAFLFVKIFKKVFPVIIVPLAMSLLMRRFTPRWHRAVAGFAKDKSYYLWSVCVGINCAQIARILCMGIVDLKTTLIYVFYSGLLCMLNFILGKTFGNGCDDRISAGQSLGQKNTILAIWVAMTFLDPSTGIILGAYMIWQNIFNALQISFPKLR